MISRETAVHLVAVGLAFGCLLAADAATDGPVPSVLAFLLFYGLVLGGAHFYLAVRGEDGMVPVASRWRYVTLLAVLFATGAVIAYWGDRTVATIELESIGTVIIGLTLVAYLLAESIDGYRASRAE